MHNFFLFNNQYCKVLDSERGITISNLYYVRTLKLIVKLKLVVYHHRIPLKENDTNQSHSKNQVTREITKLTCEGGPALSRPPCLI